MDSVMVDVAAAHPTSAFLPRQVESALVQRTSPAQNERIDLTHDTVHAPALDEAFVKEHVLAQAPCLVTIAETAALHAEGQKRGF